MPSNDHGALIVFGSGPGIGRSVAALFASRGFQKVILLSRNAERLAEDAEVVRNASAATEVFEIALDLGDIDRIESSLQTIQESVVETSLDCVLFNAARLGKSEFFEFSPEKLEADLRVSVIGLYAIAQWAIPRLLASGASSNGRTPSLLVTSGMLTKDPFPAMFSLAACKAAQYSLVHSLHKEYEPKGVHCSVIVIGGTVSDKSQVTNARNIAEEAWRMFKQPSGKGELEVVLTDPAYAEHIKNRER